jgi:lipoprotein-anchoring transpeptidase ErfK/SrfK
VAEPARPVRSWRRSLVARLAVCAAIAVGAGVVLVSRDATEQADPPTTTTGTASTTTAIASTTTATASTTTTAPHTEVPASTDLASPNGEISAYDAPGGREIGKVGLWYGYPMTMPILEERGTWLQIMMPERPNGLTAWVQAGQVTRSTSRWRMVVDLSETRVFVYRDGYETWSAPVGIGEDSTRTPTGSYFVAVIENPGRPGYGPIVLDLNAHSEDIESWEGAGDAIIAFHGSFGADQLIRAGGAKVSNGCIRMLLEDQLKMDRITLGSPVDIVV